MNLLLALIVAACGIILVPRAAHMSNNSEANRYVSVMNTAHTATIICLTGAYLTTNHTLLMLACVDALIYVFASHTLEAAVSERKPNSAN